MAPGTKLVDLILHPEDAVAGHDGVMISDTGTIIVKPCTRAEITFYESIADHEDFAGITPVFMGHLNISTQAERAELSNPDPMSVRAALQQQIDNTQSPTTNPQPGAVRPQRGARLQTDVAVALRNIAEGFIRPNILDVKLGRRLWADDASQEKRSKLSRVSAATTSGSLGMRVAGMRVWYPLKTSPQLGEFVTKDKDYGKSLTDDTILDAFKEFFCDGQQQDRPSLSQDRRAVVELCESEIERIEAVLEQNETRMFSSSILFVFEGDREALSKAFDAMADMQAQESGNGTDDPIAAAANDSSSIDSDENEDEESSKLPRIFEAKLIDFAHAQWTPGQGPDENVLLGVRCIRSLFARLLREASE